MSFVAYSRRSFSGTAPDTALAAGIDGSTLTVTVVDATGWPDGTGGDFIVTFEPGTANEEKALGASRSGNTITLAQRALEGSAVAHVSSAVVRHGLAAVDVDEANYAVSQTVGKVAAKGDILYGSAANTLVKLAKGSAGQAPTWQSDGSLAAANPVPAAHTHAESDVTSLVSDIAGKMANPGTAWVKGSLLHGTGSGTFDTLAVGATGQVLTVSGGDAAWVAAPSNTPLALVDYTSTSGTLSTSALTVVDSTNLSPSFSVPASGKVLIRVGGVISTNQGGNSHYVQTFGWLNHAGGAQVGRSQVADTVTSSSGLTSQRFSCAQILTGLTPGALQLDLAAQASGVTQKLTDITIEVWASA